MCYYYTHLGDAVLFLFALVCPHPLSALVFPLVVLLGLDCIAMLTPLPSCGAMLTPLPSCGYCALSVCIISLDVTSPPCSLIDCCMSRPRVPMSSPSFIWLLHLIHLVVASPHVHLIRLVVASPHVLAVSRPFPPSPRVHCSCSEPYSFGCCILVLVPGTPSHHAII